ncbi:MAG: LytTR family DNA-binding domain-containing protein [Flammeovirgaceae bacterium]|nr:LytTR family DNA-binding domain-containing protein [Flammeovirgaceae bacterium]
MKVLLIEDEAPAARRLQKLLMEIDPDFEVLDIIDSVEDTVKWLNIHQHPELIFMDIQLADGLSFEIFEQVKITQPVIFTTAYDDYMLQAFKVNSIDYLLKPINKYELLKSIKKLKEIKQVYAEEPKPTIDITALIDSLKQPSKSYKSRFLVKIGDKLISVPEEEIAYFTAEDRSVLLVTSKNKKYVMDHTLDELEQQLNPDKFFRLNRQFLARITAIREIQNYFNGKLIVFLQLESSQNITVSREKNPIFKKWLDE